MSPFPKPLGSKWTPEEDQLLTDLYQGEQDLSYQECATRLGRPLGSVGNRIKKLKLVKRKKSQQVSSRGVTFSPKPGVLVHLGTYGSFDR